MFTRTVSAFFAAACLLEAAERYKASEPHMGTLATITLYTESPEQAQQAFVGAFARIAGLHRILSDYDPTSELSRSCAEPRSADFIAVAKFAEQMRIDSQGAFDIRAGAVTHLWRAAHKRNRVPSPQEIAHALRQHGKVCDAGGIAKGYAADQALAAMRRLGIHSALVALSGDVAIGDAPPGKPGWRIQVGGEIHTLSNVGVSTSGDEFQHLDSGGIRFSHIVDPSTGEALRNSFPVSAIASTATEADAVATAVSVGGFNTARRLQAKRRNLQIFIEPASPAAAPRPPATPTRSH